MRFCKEQKQIEVVLTKKKKKKLLFCKQKKDKTKRFASRISSQLLQKNPYPFFLVNLQLSPRTMGMHLTFIPR
jgi:hypothetical protein